MKSAFFYFVLSFATAIFQPLPARCQKDTSITVYFSSGKFRLTKAQTAQISGLHEGLPVESISITGFTDTVGSGQGNRALGYQRALSVYVLLKSRMRCDSFRLESKGESDPASLSDLAKNRRVLLNICYSDPIAARITGPSDSTTTDLDVPDIHFKPDLPSIESESLEVIKETASKMNLYHCSRYEIIGYVNWTPNDNIKNDEGIRKQVQLLSEKRARTVYELLAEQGVSIENMSYAGKGNQDLKFDSPATDQEKRQNMRVRIVVHQATGCGVNVK